MLKRLWILPILAILTIGLVAAACGDDDEESTATRTPTASPTATRPAATATPRATGTPAASPTSPAATATPAPTATAAATATPAPTATPAAGATQIEIVAAALGFDKGTLEVTAGQPFTVTLDNQDSVTHNLHIYTQEGGDSIAVTDPESVSPGGTGILTTTITQPGEYYFQCDFHPAQMNGTLTVN